MVVVAAMLVAALSMWTAIPLTWIYIGSKLSETQFPSGGPYMIVLVGIIVSILVVAWLIGRLNHLYVRITGTNSVNPMRSAWLRSMRDTPASQLVDDRRGGAGRLGAAGRARPDRLVPAARRLAAAQSLKCRRGVSAGTCMSGGAAAAPQLCSVSRRGC